VPQFFAAARVSTRTAREQSVGNPKKAKKE
jgi:hypothetical protein